MLKFLRYGTRHNLYYHPTFKSRDGALNIFGWSLNPISSVYDGKQKSFHEPLWLFRWRRRTFANAGATTCQGHPAMWSWGPDGARTCSYCGSIHPEDFTDIMWRYSQREEGYDFDRSDKGYKDYGNRPGVRNASEGGIKFYGWHVPEDVAAKEELYAARELATIRWSADMDARWGSKVT